MGDDDDTLESTGKSKKANYARPGVDVAKARALIARVVWGLCLVFALVLALGALLVALKANPDNNLVTFIKDAADNIDLGVFDKDNGIFKFDDKDAQNRELKNALVNWGLGAIVWLIIGKIAERVIKP